MSTATGYIPRDYTAQPMGSIPFCRDYDRPLIPRNEWKDRIDAMNAAGSSALDCYQRLGGMGDDQNGFNYCWIHGAVNDFLMDLAASGVESLPELSPTAGAIRIKGGRNVGGNTFDAIPFMAEHGIALASDWPKNARRGSDRTWENARQYRVLEWTELEPNNFEQLMTELLHGNSVTIGLMHWRHMVCAGKPIYRGAGRSLDDFGYAYLNSHGRTWGEFRNGTGVFYGRKAIAFDQCAIRTTTMAVAA